MEIIALGLSRALTELEVRELFAGYGEVSECTLVMNADGETSKGFAFVTMPNDDEASLAIAALHDTAVNGKRIRVKEKLES